MVDLIAKIDSITKLPPAGTVDALKTAISGEAATTATEAALEAVELQYGPGIIVLDADTPVPDGTAVGTLIARTGASTPTPTVYLDDGFDRSVSGGWGIAPIGSSWGGGGSHVSVSSSAGRISRPAGSSQGMFSDGSNTENIEILTCTSIETAGTFGGIHSIRGRYGPGGTVYYGLRMICFLGGDVTLQLQKGGDATIGSALTLLTGYTATTKVWTRFQIKTESGATRLKARIWYDGSTEPTSWHINTTDSTSDHQAVTGKILWDAYTGGSETITLEHALHSIHATEVYTA